MCLQQYHQHAANGQDLQIGDAIPPISLLPFVNWCLLDLLLFLDELLGLGAETAVRPMIQGIATEIASRARARIASA
jgi:hypothetical protein